MTDKQRLQLRQSEIRSRLAELAAADATDETRSEIDTLGREYQGNESRIRAFTIAGDTEPLETRSTEDRERRELHQSASVGSLVYALLNGKTVDGAMAEYQSEYGLADNEISIRQLINTEHANPERDLETRAVTPAPANVGQTQQGIIPYVFPMAVAGFLGVDSPVVGVGESVFPVLTSELAVRTPDENADADETTGSFSADVLSPKRLQAAFFYSREDRARFAGMDSALRENLSLGLADGLDKEIIAGDNGLLGTNGLTARTGDAASAADFATYRGLVYDNETIDGRYAGMASDVRVVMGPHGYNHAAGAYRGNNADDSALDSLIRISGGVRVSAHVPDPASNDQDVIIRKGLRRDMVAPIWENVALIPDEVTKAKAGQIVITAVMLHNLKVLRADGFERRKVQVA